MEKLWLLFLKKMRVHYLACLTCSPAVRWRISRYLHWESCLISLLRLLFNCLPLSFLNSNLLSKEGESGRRTITKYTRYGTVVLSIIQGFFIATGLEGMTSPNGVPIVIDPSLQFKLMTVLTLTSGTAFIMWLGEQMTERGIGNGISMIIFSGIVARMPAAVMNTVELIKSGELSLIFLPVIVVMMFFVIGFIIFIETSQRRIPIQYAKRVVGRRVYGGQSSHLPLKINVSGVIPPIFASSIMMFPATIGSFIKIDWVQQVSAALSPGTVYYYINVCWYGCFLLFFLYCCHF